MVLPVIIMMPLSKIRQFQPKYTCSDKKNESLFYVTFLVRLRITWYRAS